MKMMRSLWIAGLLLCSSAIAGAVVISSYEYGSALGNDPTAQGWTDHGGTASHVWCGKYDTAVVWPTATTPDGWRCMDITTSTVSYGFYEDLFSSEEIADVKNGFTATWTFSLDGSGWSPDGATYSDAFFVNNPQYQQYCGIAIQTQGEGGFNYALIAKSDASGNLVIDDFTTLHTLTSGNAFDTVYTVTITYDGSNAVLSYGGNDFTLSSQALVAADRVLFGDYSGKPVGSVVYQEVTVETPDSDIILLESDDATTVAESGTTDTYSLALGLGAPTDDVTITMTDSSDPAQVQFLINGTPGNVVTFTAANWDQPQVVTVEAIDDAASEATHYAVIEHSCVSSDSRYNNLEIPDVRAKITDNDGNCIKVFLMGGQSNAAGSGLNTDYPAIYQTPQYDVEFWMGGRFTGDRVPDYQFDRSADTEFGPLQLGSGNLATHSGFEMSLGRTLKDSLPNSKIAIVKYGMSGSALYRGLRPDGAGDWDSDPAPLGTSFDGVRYHVFKNSAVLPALQAITDRGDSYEIAGMFWMQGETDSSYTTSANAYEANLQKLISAVRTEFSAPNMKFFIGRIRPLTGLSNYPYASTVRTAMQNVAAADPLTDWINTDDLTVNADNLHYDSAGLVEMGQRFATAYVSTLSRECDLQPDGNINLADFSKFAEQWLLTDCLSCSAADFNNDLDVNIDDLLFIVDRWLN